MATAHFYELEDVVATLLYSIQIQDEKTAIGAANELAASDEISTLERTLWLAWMLAPPSTEYDAEAAKSYASKNYGLLLEILVSTKAHVFPQRYKIWKTTDKPIRTVIDYILKKAESPLNRAELLITYIRPFLEHNKRDIMNLLEVYGAPKVLTEALSQSTGPISYRILVHACYAAFPSNTNQTQKQTQKIILNTTTDFHKARRTFQINPLALSQWNLKSKPLTKLMGSPTLILESSTKIWRTVCTTHGVSKEGEDLAFSSDELLEAFYLTYFPSDIPDEWSTMERAKSHGIVVPLAHRPNPWTQLFPI